MGLFKNLLGTVLNEFRIGKGAGDKYIYANIRAATRPGLKWDDTDARWELSNDGTHFARINLPQYISLALNASTSSVGYIVVGAFGFDSTAYPNAAFYLDTTAYVTLGSLTGSIQLYNFTDSAEVVALNITDIVSTRNVSSDLAPSLPASGKMYELRIKVTGGAGQEDRINCMWAGLRIVP
jgi:hypothetical protein